MYWKWSTKSRGLCPQLPAIGGVGTPSYFKKSGNRSRLFHIDFKMRYHLTFSHLLPLHISWREVIAVSIRKVVFLFWLRIIITTWLLIYPDYTGWITETTFLGNISNWWVDATIKVSHRKDAKTALVKLLNINSGNYD